MWFEGSIQEALDKSKNESILLIIFVQGENEDSVKLRNQFETNHEIQEKCKNFILLKLNEGTVNTNLFKQIYPFNLIPTIYLISNNGQALEQISGLIECEQLLEKLDKVLNLHNKKLDQQEQEKQEQLPQDQQLTQIQQDQQQNNLSNKDKQKRAQELLEEIRIKKAKEEEENLRLTEKNRIKASKEIQKAKELQRQKEIENLIIERKREQLEAKLAKEKILAQIRQDHEERKQRLSETQILNNTNKPTFELNEPKLTSDDVRLQFRLPNSNVLRNVFKINDTLQDVIKYVEQNSTYENITFATAFPKKKFDSNDLTKTLVELKLAPSANLIVIENKSSLSSPTYNQL